MPKRLTALLQNTAEAIDAHLSDKRETQKEGEREREREREGEREIDRFAAEDTGISESPDGSYNRQPIRKRAIASRTMYTRDQTEMPHSSTCSQTRMCSANDGCASASDHGIRNPKRIIHSLDESRCQVER